MNNKELADHYNEEAGEKYQQGLNIEAIWYLDQAIELIPDEAVYWRARSVVYYHRSLFEKALSDIEEAIRLDPDSKVAHFGRYLILEKLGREEEAYRSLDESEYCNFQFMPKEGDKDEV